MSLKQDVHKFNDDTTNCYVQSWRKKIILYHMSIDKLSLFFIKFIIICEVATLLNEIIIKT